MDGSAINAASDQMLKSIGLIALGDIISLRMYTRQDTSKELSKRDQMKSLVESVRQGKSQMHGKKDTLFITAGLQNFSEKLQKFTYVKKTGGARKLSFLKSSTMESIKEELTSLYFPSRMNPVLGSQCLYEISLGNFSGEEVQNEQTLDKYIKDNSLKHVRLYLKTKKISFKRALLSNSDSDSDDFLEKPIFKKSSPKILDDASSPTTELMTSRNARVMPEPSLEEPCATITIRHPHLSNKVRLFHENYEFSQVYDWIGGMSPSPKYFEIIDYSNKVVNPYDKIYSGVFNVKPRDSALPMTPRGSVAFQGFATSEQVVPSHPSDVIVEKSKMEESKVEPNVHVDLPTSDSSINDFEKLDDLRQIEKSRLNITPLLYSVKRDNIYEDMISLYKKRGTISHITQLEFESEPAVGDGVTKDCYTAFFDKFYEKLEGTVEKVPVDDIINDEELELIGSIIHHAFIQYNIFPLQLSKASLKKVLFDSTKKEDLMKSFLNFVTSSEAEYIKNFIDGREIKEQALVDVLYSYNIYQKPTKDNVIDLVLRASHTALIKRPYLQFIQISNGMGSFWKRIDASMIDSLYSLCTPTADSLIKQLLVDETCPQDATITTYLHRYIRSCSKNDLQLLVRFITGSTTLLPNATIKVEFVDQSPKYLHPLSQTCFKILILPRQFRSFTQFSQVIPTHLSSEEHWSVYDSSVGSLA